MNFNQPFNFPNEDQDLFDFSSIDLDFTGQQNDKLPLTPSTPVVGQQESNKASDQNMQFMANPNNGQNMNQTALPQQNWNQNHQGGNFNGMNKQSMEQYTNQNNVQMNPNVQNRKQFNANNTQHNINTSQSKPQPKEESKKKKSTRPQKKRRIQSRVKKACLACRRSHIACNTGRPCANCLKRGIPCVDSDDAMKDVAFAFNNTLPKKRKSEKPADVFNDNDNTNNKQQNHPISPAEGYHPLSTTNDSAQFQELKNMFDRQQQMLSLLMSQMQIQNQEINRLKGKFETQPRIQSTMFHSVPVGPWDDFANSPDHGVFVFKNDDTQQLLGFNTAMAKWKQQDPVDLKVNNWTWWKMSEKNVLPKSVMCLVKSGHRSLYFNFKVETQDKRQSEVRVSIHVQEAVWWILVDFSLCGSEPHPVKCLPDQTCPLKKDRIQRECHKDEANFTKSMDILLGSKEDEED